MKEYTGTTTVLIEVTIKAKSKAHAEKLFEEIFPIVSIENEGQTKIIDERTSLDNNCEWEVIRTVVSSD
jgi:hypothetical protein